LWHAIWK